MTQFLTSENPIPAHMAFPSFLLEMTELSDSAKIIYCVLLCRAQLSQKRDSFTDEHGYIFIYYPIKDLAKAVHKSEMSVKTALSALEKHELIVRKRQGVGKANRIYVKFPVDRNLSVRQTENCPPDGKKPVCHAERKLSGRYIEGDNKKIDNRMSKAYGKYQNVFLSDDDISILQRTVPPYREYIERLSTYITNKYLDEANRSDAHIDHRSHADRGLDEQPTIHEGYVARTIEQKGFVADRCEINRQIKADNALLRELKTTMRKISQSVKNTLPALAEAMETLREKMIVLRYHLQIGNAVGRKGKHNIQAEKATLAKYTSVAEQITAKKKERKELQNKKKSTSVLRIAIQRDLSRQIAELTEELEELQSENQRLLRELKCADDSSIQKLQSEIAKVESALATLEETEKKNTSKLQKALRQYKIYREKAKAFNPAEFLSARMKIRLEKEESAEAKLKSSYGKNFREVIFLSAINDTDAANRDHLDVQTTDKSSASKTIHKPHIK